MFENISYFSRLFNLTYFNVVHYYARFILFQVEDGYEKKCFFFKCCGETNVIKLKTIISFCFLYQIFKV